MTEKKTQTILKLKQAVPYDIQAVSESIFFRSYSTRPMPDAHRLKHLRKERIVVAFLIQRKFGSNRWSLAVFPRLLERMNSSTSIFSSSLIEKPIFSDHIQEEIMGDD